ncbi:hypothetical protein D1871_10660 [Nakamurella silvestris]|nr:hypothetical protein D1871_10660 [Nakamurella silvestris]
MLNKPLSPGRWLQQLPDRTFVRPADIPATAEAAQVAVSRAARRGDLVKVRHGLYFKGPRVDGRMAGPDAEELAAEVLGSTGVGPAGASAARALGLAGAAPEVDHYAVVGHPSKAFPDMVVHSRNNRARLGLGFIEIGLLEVLRAPEVYLEDSWAGVVASVIGLIAAGRLNFVAVRRAIRTEHNARARENIDRLAAEIEADSEAPTG